MTSEILNSASPLIALIIDYALDMVGAVLLLIAGWIVAGWVKKRIARMLGSVERVDATLLSFVTQLVRYLILILVMVAVLAQFGVQTASIIAVLRAAGLAVGLALQGTLANIAAGVLLLFLRPFKIGEYIDAGGVAGTVREIGLFATEFKSYDGIFVMVPNSQLASAAITNYSRLPTRRLDLVIGISYGDNMNQAMTVLNDLLVNDDRILKDPAHQVMVKELADSSVNLNMRCWTNRQDYWSLLFDLTQQAKERLDEHGISIPFPQRDVHLFPSEAPAVKVGQSVASADDTEYAASVRKQTEREESE